MRLLHCADLHLDSKLTANLDSLKAKERRAELLVTFENMVSYADSHGADSILIAGDLFDTKNITMRTRNAVATAITSHPGITFYYLKGNHDVDNFLSSLEEIPENLKLFGPQWTSYSLNEAGTVVLTGLELSTENQGTAYTTLLLDPEKVNLVTLHGQESNALGKDKAEVIHLNALKNKSIDYLALGHVHFYKQAPLDGRGVYCYPGCLEGRGFDECGEHGFVMVEIDEEQRKVTSTFVPFAYRKLYELHVDITGCATSGEAAQVIGELLDAEEIGSQHLVKLILEGSFDVEAELDLAYLTGRFASNFYFLKIYNQTHLRVNAEDYALESSLKGEFVRTVLADSALSEEDKAEVIRYGLQAIQGEEIGE